MYIYVLQCEDNKYYVGKSKNYDNRFEKHVYDYGSAWTKKYKPIKIHKVIPCHDSYDEDKYTKIYMEKYGIDNVRGGSYTSLTLSNEIKKFIEREILTAKNLCYICKSDKHFAFKCPKRFITFEYNIFSIILKWFRNHFYPYIRRHS